MNDADARDLDEQGYVAIEDVLDHASVAKLNRRLDELIELEGDAAGTEVHTEPGTQRLSNLIDKGDLFRIVLNAEPVLDAISHVLSGDFKLSSLNARFALPGKGEQGWHVDWSGPVEPGEYQVCNSIWLLDDFTEDNGATRVVPGSHRWGRTPVAGEPLPDGTKETLLTGRAGTVVVFNSHLWHAGTLNRSAARRRAMHGYFTRNANPQQTDQSKWLSAGTVHALTERERELLAL